MRLTYTTATTTTTTTNTIVTIFPKNGDSGIITCSFVVFQGILILAKSPCYQYTYCNWISTDT